MTLDQYAAFAQVYDLFMDNIDYRQWCARLCDLLRGEGITDGIVCELGCGTGSMTELLAEAGYDMIGIDASWEMLEIATEKKLISGHDILYLQQDVRDFELYGTVRAVISVCDSLNYITDPEELLQVFRLVNNYLDPGGIFLFDMNAPPRYASVGDDTIAENREDGSFIWENQYDAKTQINEYLLTLFLPEKNDAARPGQPEGGTRTYPAGECLYRKAEEYHCQRAYTTREVRDLLQAAGMEWIGAWDGYGEQTAGKDSERVLYVARERGKSHMHLE